LPNARFGGYTAFVAAKLAVHRGNIGLEGVQTMPAEQSKSPEDHARACEHRIEELRNHLRTDIEKVHEPRMQAMFETAAEVLGGLAKAFRDYREKQETAFKKT
jgi:hypothetical protein